MPFGTSSPVGHLFWKQASNSIFVAFTSKPEEKYVNEIRKLRRELDQANEKILNLTTQLTANVSFYSSLYALFFSERALVRFFSFDHKSCVLKLSHKSK